MRIETGFRPGHPHAELHDFDAFQRSRHDWHPNYFDLKKSRLC